MGFGAPVSEDTTGSDGEDRCRELGRARLRTQMTVLDDILAGVREDLAARRAVSLDDLKRDAQRMPDAKDPMPAFRGDGISIIAEVKRSSPSKGELAEINDPAALAVEYEGGGAAAISVLTEQRRFNGTWTTCARSGRVDVPVLRKDFIVSSYQLWEARAAGADMALLIVAALEQEALVSLIERAVSIGLTPLVEVHDEEERAGPRTPARPWSASTTGT